MRTISNAILTAVLSQQAQKTLGVIVAALAFTAISYGQVGTGTLVGTVTDPSGAVVTGARIIATSSATGQTRQTMTDGAGIYTLPSLPPSTYAIAIDKSGFGAETTQVNILIDQTARQDFTLKISGASATVVVLSQNSAALETESHEVAENLNGATLQNLPQTGRNVFSELEAAPNVTNDVYSNDAGDIGFFGTGAQNLTIGGTVFGNTSYLQDGVLNYNLLTKTANLQPTPEDVNEVNVQANGASARYDEPGVVNIVTKGGTNSFHGQVYDYLQNDDLDATGYFNTNKQEQRYNQFGASIGGPILRNKLQFFFAYDGLRQHSFADAFDLVATPAQFGGNFGSTVIIDPTTGLPFPNNTIPSTMISSFAKGFIPYFPAPNGSFQNGASNYESVQGRKSDYDLYIGRLDYNIGAKDTTYGAYETVNPVSTGTSWIAPTIFDGLNTYSATNAYVQETHTFGPNLVNVARFGYNYSNVYETIAGAGKANYTQQFGVPFVTPSLSQEEPPTLSFSAHTGFGNAFSPDGATQHVYEFSDELNQVIGKHSIFYGIEADKMDMDGSWVIWNDGEFDFNGQYTGNDIADFLLGYPDTAYGGLGYTYGSFHQWEVMPYVQDDWKLSNRLTLNLGIRYDYYQSPNDSDGHAGVFHLSTGSVVQGSYSQQYNTVAPRVGFAYLVDNKTVLRGGYGIYYSTFMYNELQFMLAHYPNYALEINTFASNQPTPIQNTFVAPTGSALGTFTTGASMPAPTVQQWNLAVQRSFGSNWVASLTYLGNKAQHLQQRFNPNQASLPIDPNNPSPIQSRRPYPNVGDVYEAGDVGWANYNGLQAEVTKRMSRGFSLDANYVWSKAMDDQSQDNQVPRDGTDLALDYGPADFNRTHVFKFSGVWEIPAGPGKSIATKDTWFNRLVIGGWQVSGLLAGRSGVPFSVFAANNADIGSEYQEYANISCSDPYATNRTPLNWLKASCFSQPNGTLGDLGRNSLRGPHTMSFDASASKYFPVSARIKVKLSADFINALSHPMWQFGFGSQSVANPSNFGMASYLGSPRVIQGSLHVEF